MSNISYIVILLGVLFGSPEAAGKCKAKKGELDQCLGVVAPLMPKVGLPHTRPQLNNMCRAFKGGMACVDRYTSSCLSTEERTELEQHLKGARSFLAFLCDDPVFQRDYLSHGSCLRDVSDDWEKCHYHFKHLVSLQHRIPNITEATRDHNICCIREGFLSCVYGVSYFRCEKHQAMFLKKVTATLSYNDVQEEKCRNVSLRMCSGAAGTRGTEALAAALGTLALLWWRRPSVS
ncbi:uncharacterized protein LOC125031172 [Penaeus chinensis]|uniref:uncharacterized protein LOC125031172 n=1 Tax=Penaeus chinensis TaxID=139456 RepID=UPI001FB81DCC|nr:uncharacterized protein LOC125031172 [Penaeus chinensis]